MSELALKDLALETCADAILITDVGGVIEWVNPAFTTLTGYSREEAVGQTPRILRSGKHDSAFYQGFWSTIRAGKVWRGEFTNRRKDGTLCHDAHTVSPVRGPEGEITHFVGILHDITEQKRTEEQLRDANAQLRQLLEHSPAVLYALSLEGGKIIPRLASENVSHLLGFPVAETMTYEWWLDRLHPDDRDQALAGLDQTLTLGVNRSEYRLRHKDGSYRCVEDNRRLIRDAQGEPVELVGVWTDITERRNAQAELRISEQRLSDMLRNLQLLSVMLDRDGRITYCNDFLLRLTGWRSEEVLGRDWFELFVPPEALAERRLGFEAQLSDAPESWNHETEILTRSGERRLIHWNNSALRSASGEAIGTASIGDDVTERKNLQNQMLRAQRLESIGTLSSGIAHDLNNLFMPILMGATLLRRFETSERSLKAIENIERCVRRGTDLVKQVLLFARGMEGARVAADLAGVVSEIQAIVLSTFPKNVTFSTAIDPNTPRLTGDPTQLAQVLLNLCVNARDAMPEGGNISVHAGMTEVSEPFATAHGVPHAARYALLEVADDGSGMTPEVLDRIFEPFFTTKPVGKGTGLGLSTARGIVRSHDGFMTATSEIGKGTTFKVYLPAASPDTPAMALDPGPEAEVPRGNGERILVVDDESAILEVTRETLEAAGYAVLTAGDGAQAMALYAQHRDEIGLVLTDMMMPGMSGIALINDLRKTNPHVRIIAASGLDEAFHISAALKGDLPQLLVKPFTVDHMLHAIAEALR